MLQIQGPRITVEGLRRTNFRLSSCLFGYDKNITDI